GRILRMIDGHPGRSEDGHRATGRGEGVEPLDELAHDAEDAPGVRSGEVYGWRGFEQALVLGLALAIRHRRVLRLRLHRFCARSAQDGRPAAGAMPGRR